jgi:Xaa-Pro aminopeptidase/Xaa-Pro dipeptidase
MNIQERIDALRRAMEAEAIDLIIGFHDNGHFIEKPNPVMILANFKSLGDSAVLVPREGEPALIVTPAWDAERAAETSPHMKVIGTHDLVAEVASAIDRARVSASRTGVAGLAAMPATIEKAVMEKLGGESRPVDALVTKNARRKTTAEIERAREATRVAEKAYEHMLSIARPGMHEDELASEVRWYGRSLGAEDNFFMMTSGRHSMAVQTSSGRKLERGDLVLGELTPSFEGQMSQICRTLSLGPASGVVREKYELLVHAMKEGMQLARPGNTMGQVCDAINAVLEAQGYGKYCHPPHIKRRGHGLGFGSTLPGDVAPDNGMVLEEDMFFVIHPNQYLPETGYMMCGEPTLITAQGAQPLTKRFAWLEELEF